MILKIYETSSNIILQVRHDDCFPMDTLKFAILKMRSKIFFVRDKFHLCQFFQWDQKYISQAIKFIYVNFVSFPMV